MNIEIIKSLRAKKEKKPIKWPLSDRFTIEDVWTINKKKISKTSIQNKINERLKTREIILLEDGLNTGKGRPKNFYKFNKNIK